MKSEQVFPFWWLHLIIFCVALLGFVFVLNGSGSEAAILFFLGIGLGILQTLFLFGQGLYYLTKGNQKLWIRTWIAAVIVGGVIGSGLYVIVLGLSGIGSMTK